MNTLSSRYEIGQPQDIQATASLVAVASAFEHHAHANEILENLQDPSCLSVKNLAPMDCFTFGTPVAGIFIVNGLIRARARYHTMRADRILSHN